MYSVMNDPKCHMLDAPGHIMIDVNFDI